VIALCDPDFIFMKPLDKFLVPSDILFDKKVRITYSPLMAAL
jgi:hypothetical protein